MEHLDMRRKMIIMGSIMAAMFFASVNQTIVGNALPRIIAVLGGMDYYSWVFTIYMLTSAVTTILVGRLSDMYGRKPFLLIGIFVFTVGAFLAGLSKDIYQLIAFRGFQGLGAGLIMSSAFTAVGDLFSPRERGKWNGLMSSVFGLSSVFGPTMGGYIVDHFDWHWVFWVFLPLGIVAFVLIWVFFPQVERAKGQRIDYVGALLLTATIVPMLLAFSWAGTKYHWSSMPIVGLFIGAAVALVLFIIVEKKAENPILPLYLFRNSVFTISNLVGFTLGVGMFGAAMYIPFFIQGVLGFSATHSSYITMTLTLSLVAASAVSGQMISKTGKYKTLSFIGLFITVAGLFGMSTMNIHTSQWTIIVYLIAVGFGLGIAMPVFTLTVQNAVEYGSLGVATASVQLFRSLGGTVGVAIMGTVLSTRMQDRLSTFSGTAAQIPQDLASKLEALKNPQILLDPEKLSQIGRSLPEQMQPMFTEIVAHLRDAMSYALSGVFLTGMVIMVLAIAINIFLKEVPLRSAAQGTEQLRKAD
ncbi:MFS transporter [Ectobacillus sp. JY-23]|uniref:MDR family MFS transporter n=1 Tax=Ectobacillus sp. JY-23 TaxID=2933872 RepID=UPI001FF1AB22|nr:MDR family MFS transporter [Ectobacillus sp. JY-23]UOY93277.1 MFS transporter [Ectobacillus sp. JY-23]